MNLNALIENQLDDHLAEYPETGPVVTELLEANISDFDREEVWQELIKQCDRSEIQRSWSNWTNVRDREELRLRLQLIEQFESIEKELIDFIWFFYRSSDPVMYQSACRIVGKYLPDQSPFQSYLANFINKRSLSLSNPVQLNNQRSRRRLLITLASYTAHHGSRLTLGERSVELDLPADIGKTDLPPDLSNADLSVLLLSTSILCSSESHFKTEAEQPGKRLLREVAETRTQLSREILINWGRLAGCLAGEAQLIRSNLEKLVFQTITGFSGNAGRRVRALTLLDELVRNALYLKLDSGEFIRSLLDHPEMPQPLSRFLSLRFAFWSLRERRELPENLPVPDPNPFPSSQTTLSRIEAILREAISSPAASPATQSDKLYELFSLLVHTISDPQKWYANNSRDRAVIAFLLIDLGIHSGFMSTKEMIQLFSAYGFSGYAVMQTDPSAPQSNSSNTATVYSSLGAILPQLLELEPEIREGIIDARILHKISMSRILIALLPSNHQTELLPLFADAFEHLFRMQLETNPQFRPPVFIYRTTIRRPHPRFYQLLLELTKDRQYVDPNGETVPLQDMVRKVKKEAENTISRQQTSLEFTQSGAGDSDFQSALSELRTRLHAVADVEDPVAGLDRLADIIHISSRQRLHAQSGLIEFIWNINDTASFLLQEEHPPYRTTEKEEVVEKVTQWLDLLDQYQRELIPESLNRYDEVLEDCLECRTLLTRIEQYFTPICGVVEARLLSQACRHLKNLIREEEELLSALADQLNSIESRDFTSPSTRDTIFSLVTDRREGIALLLLPVAWDHGLHQGAASASEDQHWENRHAFLVWATDAGPAHHSSDEIKNLWRQIVGGAWADLLRETMAKQQEHRVAILIREARQLEVPLTADLSNLLEQARFWCFDRHNWRLAHTCRKLNDKSKSLSSSVWGTGLQYIGHYSKVWIALFVGVILMFDFGDAWTAMAEIGDVQGIALTFILGITGTYFYVYADLRKKIKIVPEERRLRSWISRMGRISVFVGLALVITSVITMLAWFLLSGTDEVVQGPNALLHIIVWTGFALFVGIFFGLIGKVD